MAAVVAFIAMLVVSLLGRLAVFIGIPIVLDATVDVSDTVNKLMWFAGIGLSIYTIVVTALALFTMVAAASEASYGASRVRAPRRKRR